MIVPERRSAPITAGQRACATFWNATRSSAVSDRNKAEINPPDR
jgi:hypothetical protein